MSALPVGERAILELVALRLLCAVAPPYIYAETAVTVECAGAEFTAKGRTVKQPGWRALDAAYRASMKNAEPDNDNEGQGAAGADRGPGAAGHGGRRQGGQDQPAQALHRGYLTLRDGDCRERRYAGGCRAQGAGDPATRAGILEKLVSTGFLERKKARKPCSSCRPTMPFP